MPIPTERMKKARWTLVLEVRVTIIQPIVEEKAGEVKRIRRRQFLEIMNMNMNICLLPLLVYP